MTDLAVIRAGLLEITTARLGLELLQPYENHVNTIHAQLTEYSTGAFSPLAIDAVAAWEAIGSRGISEITGLVLPAVTAIENWANAL